MSQIWAIILAAGESKRMGTPKMLLPFDRSTMIETVISNVLGSKADRILVVLGSSGSEIEKLIRTKTVNYCFNENYKDGMLSSVKCGLRNIPAGFRAALIFQGDQPLITSSTSDSVIDSYNLSGKGIVIPVYHNRRGHPVLIDKKYTKEIEKLSPSLGLRSLSYTFPNDVLEVAVNDPGILRDIDTYPEYEKAINQLS
jgi:molybdenum cofactor cytidylyltransferase